MCAFTIVQRARASPTIECVDASEALIIENIPLVRKIAGRMVKRMPAHTSLDDLMASGTLGLIDAARRYDPGKGAKFESYASIRIRGAIQDHLRAFDWVPRAVREQPGEAQPPAVLSLDWIVNDDVNRPLTLADSIPDPMAVDPAEAITDADVMLRLRAVVGMLNDREYAVVRLYYWQEWTMARIGEELGVTEARISQVHRNALRHLQSFLALEDITSV